MAMEYVYLSPTPVDESCAQVGEPDFRKKATKEMTAFIGQLYRCFPKAKEVGVYFRIKWQNHDFGEYGEVVAAYEMGDEEAMNLAYYVENNIPENWDDEALEELKERN